MAGTGTAHLREGDDVVLRVEDLVVQFPVGHGRTVHAVSGISLDLVRGAQVDFVDSLGGAHFNVTNPNAASGCGCGTSFSV